MTGLVETTTSARSPFSKPRHRRVVNRSELRPSTRRWLGFIGVVVILGLWQLFAWMHWVNPIIASSPIEVFKAIGRGTSNGTLWPAVGESAKLFGVGFVASLLVGVVFGVLIGWFRTISALLDPLVSLLYAAPRIALIPLITVWFGIGFKTQAVLVFLLSVFPILVNVAAGIDATGRDLVTVARSFLASDWQVLWEIAVPGALPHFISGVRQGIAQSLIGVIVAEYLLGNNGLGGLIITAGQFLDSATVYLGILIVALAALLLTGALRYLEKHLNRWQQ